MNKVILGLLVAVCVLGMALIMLNERMRKPEPANPAGIIAPVRAYSGQIGGRSDWEGFVPAVR